MSLYEKFKFIARIRKCRILLSEDIQQLAYISEELEEKTKSGTVDIYFIRNSIETLLRAMLYNQMNMKEAVEKAYNFNKIGGEKYGR